MPNGFDLSETFARAQTMLNAKPMRPLPDVITEASTASAIVRSIEPVINTYMARLNPDQEVGLALTSFGVQHVIRVKGFRSLGPSLLVIHGDEGDQPVELIQHVSQLNFLLIRLPVPSSQTEPIRKIGFQTE